MSNHSHFFILIPQELTKTNTELSSSLEASTSREAALRQANDDAQKTFDADITALRKEYKEVSEECEEARSHLLRICEKADGYRRALETTRFERDEARREASDSAKAAATAEQALTQAQTRLEALQEELVLSQARGMKAERERVALLRSVEDLGAEMTLAEAREAYDKRFSTSNNVPETSSKVSSPSSSHNGVVKDGNGKYRYLTDNNTVLPPSPSPTTGAPAVSASGGFGEAKDSSVSKLRDALQLKDMLIDDQNQVRFHIHSYSCPPIIIS